MNDGTCSQNVAYRMNLNNFLYSGFKFEANEDLLRFKFKMLNSIFIIIAFFNTLYGLFHELGILGTSDIGSIHSNIIYAYSFLTVILILFLRSSKKYYKITAHLLLIISLVTFTSALIFVPQDEFRIIWFYLLVFVTYILIDSTNGLLYTAFSIGIILTVHSFTDLHLSQTAINSGILGLIIGSFLSLVYTSKITDYENSLNRKNSTLNVLASTDSLTGIMNRRIFNEISKHYFQTAQRDDSNLTLLLLDLDHFKKINDTYGHQCGDQVLIHFAKTIEKIIRKSDIFARIGGEEFAILLSNIDTSDAYQFAENIRQAIQNMSIKYEGHNIFVTTSIGITKNSETDSLFDDVFSRADIALYRAKNEGRNRTCCNPSSGESINCPKSIVPNAQLNFSI